jgi:hypothetical protein
MRRALLLGSLMLAMPAMASAACTNPGYPEGAQYYNSTYHVMQYCDGTHWVNMGAPSNGVEDGDKGDITVSSLGTAWAIDDAAVTNAMLAGSIALSKLAVTGTPDGSKFLKDDGSWAVPAANLSGGAAGYGAVWSSASALTHDSALYVDTTNHRVGIGTTTPVYPLHVIGNARVQASSGAVYSDIVTLDTNNTYLRYSTGGSTRWVVGVDTADSNKYKLSSGVNDFSATKFTIDTSGNVGIGTATPGSKLSVNGTLDVADHITLSRPGGEFITKGSDTANYVMVSVGLRSLVPMSCYMDPRTQPRPTFLHSAIPRNVCVSIPPATSALARPRLPPRCTSSARPRPPLLPVRVQHSPISTPATFPAAR